MFYSLFYPKSDRVDPLSRCRTFEYPLDRGEGVSDQFDPRPCPWRAHWDPAGGGALPRVQGTAGHRSGLILLSPSLLVNAVLLITHSIQQARRLARRVAFLHQGKLIEQGETDVVLMKPTQAETKQFLDFSGI